jgi:hypothetical protein
MKTVSEKDTEIFREIEKLESKNPIYAMDAPFIDLFEHDVIKLDGTFTLAQLKKIVEIMEET